MSKEGAEARGNKKKTALICVSIFMCALFLLTLGIYLRSFLPVTEFELSGLTQYDKGEIVGFSGIKEGDSLYSVDLREAEKRLLESCPYIEEIEIKRKFPNTLVFRITEKLPQWYIEVSGEYYSLDAELTVIEESASRERFTSIGVSELILPNIRSLICGEVPDFGADETEVKKALELLYAVQTTSFKSRITLVDMESRFNVNITVDGKYDVYMGDISNIEAKLDAVRQILESDKLDGYAGAEIDASIPKAISVKPRY